MTQTISGFGGLGEMVQRAYENMDQRNYTFGQGYVPPGPGFAGKLNIVGASPDNPYTSVGITLNTLVAIAGVTGALMWPFSTSSAATTGAAISAGTAVGALFLSIGSSGFTSYLLSSFGHLAAGAAVGLALSAL